MNTQLSENHEAESDSIQFLSFAVGDEQYGVELTSVREIKSWEETTVLPSSPEFMKGVINLRGTVVPIFDLRARFDQGGTEISEKTSVVIVISIKGKQVGILVDAVSDILSVKSAEIKEPPVTGENSISEDYIDGLVSVDDKMVILLNTSNLFDDETLSQVEMQA